MKVHPLFGFRFNIYVLCCMMRIVLFQISLNIEMFPVMRYYASLYLALISATYFRSRNLSLRYNLILFFVSGGNFPLQ